MVLAIRLPVVRIAFQEDPLARPILLHTKWSEAHNFTGRRVQRPGLHEPAFAVRLLEDVSRQNGEAVKKPFRSGVWARQREPDGVLIDFADGRRLAIDQKQITLLRTSLFLLIQHAR